MRDLGRLNGDRATRRRGVPGPDISAIGAFLAVAAPASCHLFLFLSATALQPDTRITRYRRIGRRLGIEVVVGPGALLEEGVWSRRGAAVLGPVPGG